MRQRAAKTYAHVSLILQSLQLRRFRRFELLLNDEQLGLRLCLIDDSAIAIHL